jgi:outer membrane protein
MILAQVPEYATVQQNLDRLTADWNAEITRMQREIDAAFQEYQSRELLYTADERKEKQEEIIQKEEELEQYRVRHFGPEGELFKQQEQLMRPIQERILEAVEEVATSDSYDYVLDKSGSTLFLFYRDQYDISVQVLEEMGIDTENLRLTTGN